MTSVVISPRARGDVRAISGWWRVHRLGAPRMFVDELAAAMELLAVNPMSGTSHPSASGVGDVRRVLLRRSRYRVYYRFDRGRDRVEVLAVWHTSRGREPRLG